LRNLRDVPTLRDYRVTSCERCGLHLSADTEQMTGLCVVCLHTRKCRVCGSEFRAESWWDKADICGECEEKERLAQDRALFDPSCGNEFDCSCPPTPRTGALSGCSTQNRRKPAQRHPHNVHVPQLPDVTWTCFIRGCSSLFSLCWLLCA